jgi:hypothetical protein
MRKEKLNHADLAHMNLAAAIELHDQLRTAWCLLLESRDLIAACPELAADMFTTDSLASLEQTLGDALRRGESAIVYAELVQGVYPVDAALAMGMPIPTL